MIKRLINILFFVVCAVSMMAQSEAFDAEIHTWMEAGGQKEYRTMQYAVFKTENKANSVIPLLQEALSKVVGNNGIVDLEAWDKECVKLKTRFRKTKGNGDCKVHVFPDMAVLISTYNPDDDMTADGARFAVIVMKAGQTAYSYAFKAKVNEGTHEISNVDVLGQNRDTVSITAAPALDDGKKMYFKIHVDLPAGYGNEEGRLVVQPMAVSCQTEDTVDYINGIVMEGLKYHKMQDKRMRFNYMKNDRVSFAYIKKPMWNDEKILIDTTLVYVKPDPRQSYKIPYTVEIGDMNRVYFSRTASTGSCNSKNIFKFLDLGLAAAPMDLAEFRTDAESNYQTKNQDLRLKFLVGRSQLTGDSINTVQLNELIKELRSYGDQLMEVSVAASASPDGGLESNRRLAAERTAVAATRVRQYLGKVDIAFHTAPAKVYSWADVAEEVRADGHPDVADQIKSKMGADGYGGDAQISQIEGYQEYVMPVLDRLRIMRVTYRYEREHVMDDNEVYHAYYQRKHALLKGLKGSSAKDFSDGDYYNLYRLIQDPAEQDTLTMLAYRHVTSHPGYEQIKFSMYVANRMAMLNLRRGTPDPKVLAPFINPRLRAIKTQEPSDQPQKNRREVLINQIITYFQSEIRDTALSYCDYWFSNDKDPKVERMKQYIIFKEGFVRYATHQLSPEKEKEVLDAMNFVISCAPDNKAVIFTEARDILNVPYSENLKLINDLDDANPKKWYLRGMLEADKEEKSTGTKPKDYIPDYLCYFYASFELEPSYKWLYLNDGQISDELRAKYKFSKKKLGMYRLMFYQRVKQGKDNNAKVDTPALPDGEGEIEISGED